MDKKLNYFSTIRFLMKYIKKYKSNFIMFYSGWLFDTILSIAMPILFGIMIDEIIYYQNMSTFFRIGLVFVIISIFSCILYFFIYAQHHYLMSMYAFDIKRDVFEHLQKCDAEYMADASSGDIITLIEWYAGEGMHFIIRNVFHFFNDFISIVAITVYLFVINWKIGIFLIVAAPVTVMINTKFGRKIRSYEEKQQNYYSEYISWVYECLSALRDIRMLGAITKTNRMFEASHRKMFSANIKSGVSVLTANHIIEFTNLITQLAIFTFAGWLATSGNITIGLLSIIITFFGILTEKIKMCSISYLDGQKRVAYIQQIYNFLQSPTEDSWKGTKELQIIEGNISFQNIQFTYRKGKTILKDFDLEILAGERFAFVGKSGSGKTTLAYMLIGFYRPQQGEIYIDGQKLSDCSLKSIRQKIGLIAQDVLIFDGTIKENILLGNRKATEEEVHTACRQSGLSDVIAKLPDGLETVIGSQGVGLSGGQKQRIAIARIYLKNPKIIVFDEATSALDSDTEEAIHEAWKKVLAGRTSIVITHRQSAIMMCDRVAILEDGKISDEGIPERMAHESNLFQMLFAISREVSYEKED